jgi:membrane protease subunit (stomatin/prohibitin family)
MMGILDFLSKQFVDVIDWVEQPGDLALRYPMRDREIQNGASLTVRDGQLAFFYDEGQIADVFVPGRYTLETDNLPLLTALMNWDKAFASPFKADLYFFTMKEQAGLTWGTSQPVTVRDTEYGPLRIRAFGSYSIRIGDASVFKAKLLGTMEQLTITDIEPQLRGAIGTALASALGKGDLPFVDLAADQHALSERLREAVQPAFAAWGLEVTSFFVESVSLPENVQKHLDDASAMRVVGNLDHYTRFQTAEAIGTAAGQEGGMAGIGAGAAAGAAIGEAMAAGMAAVPATTTATADPFALIEKLHKLHLAGAISQDEYEVKKVALLTKIG